MYTNGSAVGMRTALCPVCGHTHTIDEIMIHKQMLNVFPPSGKAKPDHYELCEEHSKLFKDGYLALVGIDPEKSDFGEDGIAMHGAHRTGRIVHMRRKAFMDLFNEPNPVGNGDEDLPLTFVEDGVLDYVERLAKEAKKGTENESEDGGVTQDTKGPECQGVGSGTADGA